MNFTPNTALDKKHSSNRFPGYSRAEEREKDREAVKERKILKRLPSTTPFTPLPYIDAVGPQKVKSAYYDVTITEPRQATLAWCQAISRRGLCMLYADYFRSFEDDRCLEASGMRKNWSKISKVSDEL